MERSIVIIFFHLILVLHGEEMMNDFPLNVGKEISGVLNKVEEATPLAPIFDLFGRRSGGVVPSTPVRFGGLIPRGKKTTAIPLNPTDTTPSIMLTSSATEAEETTRAGIRGGGLIRRTKATTTTTAITPTVSMTEASEDETPKASLRGGGLVRRTKLTTTTTTVGPIVTTEELGNDEDGTTQSGIRGGGLVRRTKPTTTTTTVAPTTSVGDTEQVTTETAQWGGGLIRRTKRPTTVSTPTQPATVQGPPLTPPPTGLAADIGNHTFSKDGVKFERWSLAGTLDTIVTIPKVAIKADIPTILSIEEIDVVATGVTVSDEIKYDVFLDKDGRTTIKLAIPKGVAPSRVEIKKGDDDITINVATTLDGLFSEATGPSSSMKFESSELNAEHITTITLPFGFKTATKGITYTIDGIQDVDLIPSNTIVNLGDLSPSKGATETGVNYEVLEDDNKKIVVKIMVPSKKPPVAQGFAINSKPVV
ncbi:cell wall protein DAN4-like [Photinus pyralis]|uniref:cell wall protein DAN4-like n=1 Tax=Photinus pyralis TaxID=7054 RepID=UPI0012676B12|nr:cell wall protein DAN4-like [Photinus pyralis]